MACVADSSGKDMNITQQRQIRMLDPGSPTLYLGFSGVLHVGEGIVTEEGK